MGAGGELGSPSLWPVAACGVKRAAFGAAGLGSCWDHPRNILHHRSWTFSQALAEHPALFPLASTLQLPRGPSSILGLQAGSGPRLDLVPPAGIWDMVGMSCIRVGEGAA